MITPELCCYFKSRSARRETPLSYLSRVHLHTRWSLVFEAIVIRKSTDLGSIDGIDLGSLAEAILFYGRTDLLIGRGTMRKLLRVCGPETTVRLVEDGYVTPRYLYWDSAVYTEDSGTPGARYLPTVISVGNNFEQEIRDLWEEQVGRSGKMRRLRNRFINAVPLLDSPATFVEDVNNVVSDEYFLENAARTVIEHLAPGYRLPTGFFFQSEPAADKRIRIATNLDVSAATRFHHALRGPDAGQLDPSLILAEIADVQIDLFTAASLGSDSLASDMSSKLFTLRTARALKTSGEQANAMSLAEIAFPGRTIRETINSGDRGLEDFFPILDRSRTFRVWIRDLPDDASLAQSYFEECVRGSWVEKLPVRVLRWFMVLIASLHTPIVGGAGIAAFDSLMLNRMAGGWRPNQFIDRQVASFVSDKDGPNGRRSGIDEQVQDG